jgi:hypothetical protein
MAYPQNLVARIKKAELLSSIGAGLLGGGIALLMAAVLGRYAVPLLLLGLIIHAGGMFQKHRLEQGGDSDRILWVESLYWLCWIILGILLLSVVFRLL